jgi:hypothetical protein
MKEERRKKNTAVNSIPKVKKSKEMLRNLKKC